MLYAFKTNFYCLFIYFQNVTLRIMHPLFGSSSYLNVQTFWAHCKICVSKTKPDSQEVHRLKRWGGVGPWELPGKYQAAKVGEVMAGAPGPVARECYRKSIACILLYKSPLFRDEFYHNSKFYLVVYPLSSNQSNGAIKSQSGS